MAWSIRMCQGLAYMDGYRGHNSLQYSVFNP